MLLYNKCRYYNELSRYLCRLRILKYQISKQIDKYRMKSTINLITGRKIKIELNCGLLDNIPLYSAMTFRDIKILDNPFGPNF